MKSQIGTFVCMTSCHETVQAVPALASMGRLSKSRELLCSTLGIRLCSPWIYVQICQMYVY
ncbi:hypothetical protein ABIE37_000097 [Arthrobacter bambusae]|uniref:Uncharacterized protein n=1 Tax=Arthrobacter bambusae TaxID=1338426 RepID=A0ABV2P0Q5_9MICC